MFDWSAIESGLLMLVRMPKEEQRGRSGSPVAGPRRYLRLGDERAAR